MTRTIGGEFELDALPRRLLAQDLTQGLKGSWTVSGRAALLALLKTLKGQGIRKVLLPAYLCYSVAQPVHACGLEADYYPVSEDLAAHPQPEKNAAILLIHYFGWLNPSTEMLRRECAGSDVLIEDFTQSFLSSWQVPPESSSLIFFSMRKLGPVPLGGWFNREVPLPPMPPGYQAVFWKSVAARLMKYRHLQQEGESGPGDEPTFLRIFQSVERALDRSAEPCRLDADALKLILGINWQSAAWARRGNWATLHTLLAGAGEPFFNALPEGVVPLGYILKADNRKDLQAALSAARIICPVLWPLPPEIDKKRFPVSHSLSQSLLTLPIDQRYGEEEMETIAHVIRALV